MPDCNKRILNLTPTEVYDCFINSSEWQVLGANFTRMKDNLFGTTIGEWIEIAGAIAILPAQFASYFLPLMFLLRIIQSHNGSEFKFGEKQIKLKFKWGIYMLLAGFLMIIIGHNERFMFYHGLWEMICGGLILALGPSWWGVRSEPWKYS